jgi:hypothetical protein
VNWDQDRGSRMNALRGAMEIGARRRHGESGSFRQMNASAKRSSAFASTPRKRMRPRNV